MKQIAGVLLEVVQGDITKMEVDAIVNAANTSLLGGGGVDGAIHRTGGPEILEACKRIGGCPVGEAVITTAGKLKAKFVIHTVGPIWRGGENNEEALLRSCYRNSLQLAVEHRLHHVAFPNISTGVYCYPKELAAKAAIDEVVKFLQTNPKRSLERIVFVCYEPENTRLYQDILDKLENR
ncbi:MAG TPA: O-acetyl-ADP-ribose deacetylase [Bacillota bacterium]|jgi:O-acetyl-ADP-ribose deacetylase (regulator of RNase III)|nr:O-acetyl-ADP-ribose deacetylase [Bacillota bacterium]HPT68196.1 O-acetyl-ADP-ribose deacetylase [Bacillota bacterium]